MYFLFRNNRLYGWLVHQGPLYRYGFTFSGLVLLVGAWWFLIYNPCNAFLTVYDQKTISLNQEYLYAKKLRRMSVQLEQSIEQLKTTVLSYADQRNISDKEQVMWILKQIKQSGVILQSMSLDHECDKNWYMMHGIFCNLKATPDQFNILLDLCKNSPYLTRCTIMSLVHADHEFQIQCLFRFLTFK
jgi:hypothetical protein